MPRSLESYSREELAEIAQFANTAEGQAMLQDFLFRQMVQVNFPEPETMLQNSTANERYSGTRIIRPAQDS